MASPCDVCHVFHAQRDTARYFATTCDVFQVAPALARTPRQCRRSGRPRTQAAPKGARGVSRSAQMRWPLDRGERRRRLRPYEEDLTRSVVHQEAGEVAEALGLEPVL